MTAPDLPLIVRLMEKVGDMTDCWNWTGAKTKDGYGQISVKDKIKLAHRISYELFKGQIKEGLVINHLCSNTSCVNPEHLEVVTQKVNIQKGLTGYYQTLRTQCPRGHEYTPDNLVKQKGRACKICAHDRSKAFYAKKHI